MSNHTPENRAAAARFFSEAKPLFDTSEIERQKREREKVLRQHHVDYWKRVEAQRNRLLAGGAL